ncbi:MAG: ABC transporter ATP-binding protein [Pseudomonadota bacterium]
MARNHPILEIASVGFDAPGGFSLHDITMSVSRGEIVCLAGPSGCGKSTLLRIVAGLERVHRGTVAISGSVVADRWRAQPPECRGVGLVFQDYALFPHLTTLDNVKFGLSADFGSAQERKKRAQETIEMVGLGHVANAYPHQLSGGEQQRVALARVMAPHPPIILLDEPFSNLDVCLRQRIRDETLHLLQTHGATTVLVTHDPEEAMFMSDRIALLRDGQLVQMGRPTELYCRPMDSFVATFFGEANRVQARVMGGMIPTPLGSLEVADVADGTAVEVLVRPEGLLISPQITPGGQAIAGRTPITARVEAARLLGRTSMIHLAVPDPQASNADATVHFHARMPGQFLPAQDTLIEVVFDPSQAFVFSQDGRTPLPHKAMMSGAPCTPLSVITSGTPSPSERTVPSTRLQSESL